MYGVGFTLQRLLEAVKIEKPKSLTLGSHHYVQMSEMDISTTGMDKQDLSSVFWITPVGTSVPSISFSKLQNMFPNLKVNNVIFLQSVNTKVNHICIFQKSPSCRFSLD